MLHIQCHVTALDLSMFKGHGLKCHVPDLFYLTTCHMADSHVGKLHVMLNMEGHVFPFK